MDCYNYGATVPFNGLVTYGIFVAETVLSGDVDEIRSGDTFEAPWAAGAYCMVAIVLKALGIVACCWGVSVDFIMSSGYFTFWNYSKKYLCKYII